MRRTLFYLLVALLAFGIGSFVVFNFYWQSSENLIVVQPMKELKIDKTEQTTNPISEGTEFFRQKENFKCQNEILLAVWSNLRKNKDFKEMSNERIEKDGIVDCSEVVEINELVDLNNDGVKETVIVGKNSLVNGAQNEAIWIVQKSGKTYKVLLEESGVNYEIKKITTNGFRDVFIKSHASCCSSYKSTYKFRKGKYIEKNCLLVEYQKKGEEIISTCAEELERIEKASM